MRAWGAAGGRPESSNMSVTRTGLVAGAAIGAFVVCVLVLRMNAAGGDATWHWSGSLEPPAPFVPVSVGGKTCGWLVQPAERAWYERHEREAAAANSNAKERRPSAAAPEVSCHTAHKSLAAHRRRELLEAGRRRAEGSRGAAVVEAEVRVANWTDGPGQSLGSGSVLREPGGAVLVTFDRWMRNGGTDVYASRDGRLSRWERVARHPKIKWATLFEAGGHVYVLGVESFFWYTVGRENPLVVARMVPGSGGRRWTAPVSITPGRRVHVMSGGVTVSRGEVFVTFTEDGSAPARFPVLETRSAVARVRFEDLDGAAPDLVVDVRSAAEAARLPQYGLVALTREAPADRAGQLASAHVLYLRVRGRRGASLVLRPERWENRTDRGPKDRKKGSFEFPLNRPARGPWSFPAGSWLSPLMTTFGDMQWGMLRAPAGADLLRAEAWTAAEGVMANPATADPLEWDHVLGVRPVLTRVEGQPHRCGLQIGEGECPYWQEGVAARREHLDPGALTVALRMTNDEVCDLALLVGVELGGNVSEAAAAAERENAAREATNRADQAAEPAPLVPPVRLPLHGRFEGASSIPGMSVVRTYFAWDGTSQMYWAVANVVHHVVPGRGKAGAWPRCTWDRSTLMLMYSTDMRSWFSGARVAAASLPGHHYSYGHFAFDGPDLLVVAHSSPDGWVRPEDVDEDEDTKDRQNAKNAKKRKKKKKVKVPPLRMSHNSPYVTLHRVRNFRDLADPVLVYRESLIGMLA